MPPIELADTGMVLLALLPAVVIGAALGSWLRRRSHHRTEVVFAAHGSAMCNQCPAYVTGLSRRAARAWARGHAAQYHPDPSTAAIR